MSHNASLADYRTALTTHGAGLPTLCSLLARLPVAMIGFSVLLYTQHVTGSFAVAGLVGASLLVGVAIGSVVQGRIIDRFGPTRPILLATAIFTAAIITLVTEIERGAPTALLVALAVTSGSAQPGVPSAARSLWARLLPPGPAREAAYAYEAISMEVFFILGPGFAGLMLLTPWPGSGVVAGAACMALGSAGFALSPAARAWRARPAGEHAGSVVGALASAGMRTLVIAVLGFGVVIGFVEVAVPAVATRAGAPTIGGLLLSVWSLSSVLFGLGYSLRPWPRPLPLRLPVLLAGFGVLVGLLFLPTSLAPTSLLVLAGCMVIAGALITPQATSHSTAIDVVAPAGTATEAFGWVITAATLGLSVGHSTSGLVVERFGPPMSFLAAACCGLLLAALVWARRHTLRRSAQPVEVGELGADAGLGRSPQLRVDVGVDELDDLTRTRVGP